MCKFFSLVSDGNGKIMYCDWEVRKKILAKEEDYNFKPDSHTAIAKYHGYKAEEEDALNKYEFNPLTREFTVDQINTTDDSCLVKLECERLDFKKIVAPLIIKDIIHPLKLKKRKVTKRDKKDLILWASVRASVRASVWASVRASVRDSVGDSVWDSVWDSVGDSVGASVRASVWASVRASVRDSVGDSVWDSVVWYYSSFFHFEYSYDFSPCLRLWERGFVPSFDGKTWRLHAGENADIVYEWTPKA